MSAASRNNGSAAASSSGEFTLTILAAQDKKFELDGCTSNTLVFELLRRLYEENNEEKDEPVIVMENPKGEILHLIPTDKLANYKINGSSKLTVVFDHIFPSCLQPSSANKPFFKQLHEWIELDVIKFDKPFKSEPIQSMNGPPMLTLIKDNPANNIHICKRGITLLANYNHWRFDREILFFLSTSQPNILQNLGQSQMYDSGKMNGSVEYMIDTGYGRARAPIQYFKFGRGNTREDINITDGSSVRGTLTGIELIIDQMAHTGRGDISYSRRCTIIVELRGYIEIRDLDGTITIPHNNNPHAICYVPYEQIIMCERDGNLPGITEENISKVAYFQGNNQGNLAGGKRRTRRLKRSKRSKRSKNKKTRGRSRK